MKVEIYKKEGNYGRHHTLVLENDTLKFDTSDGEYGVGSIKISQLEELIKNYKNGKTK